MEKKSQYPKIEEIAYFKKIAQKWKMQDPFPGIYMSQKDIDEYGDLQPITDKDEAIPERSQ